MVVLVYTYVIQVLSFKLEVHSCLYYKTLLHSCSLMLCLHRCAACGTRPLTCVAPMAAWPEKLVTSRRHFGMEYAGTTCCNLNCNLQIQISTFIICMERVKIPQCLVLDIVRHWRGKMLINITYLGTSTLQLQRWVLFHC